MKEVVLLRLHAGVAHASSSILYLFGPVLLALQGNVVAGIAWLFITHAAALVVRTVGWGWLRRISPKGGAFGLILRSIGLLAPAINTDLIWAGAALAGIGSALFLASSTALIYRHAANMPGKGVAGHEMARSAGTAVAALAVATNLIVPGASAFVFGSLASLIAALLLLNAKWERQDSAVEQRPKMTLPRLRTVPPDLLLANLAISNEIVIIAPIIVATNSGSGWIAVGVALAQVILGPFMGRFYDKNNYSSLLTIVAVSSVSWVLLWATNAMTGLSFLVSVTGLLVVVKITQSAIDTWRSAAVAARCNSNAGDVVATIHIAHSGGATLVVLFILVLALLSNGPPPVWLLLIAPAGNLFTVWLLCRQKTKLAVATSC